MTSEISLDQEVVGVEAPQAPNPDPIQAPESTPETSAAPEALADMQTAQIPVNEPFASESEPVAEALPEVPATPSAGATISEEIPPASPEPVTETIAIPVMASRINPILELLNKARLAMQSRKRKKIDRILNMFTTKSKITNDEVEKLLHVSDATATRYLEILEKENKIKQIGKTGKGVHYVKM
jgi:hypothetical protein